MQLIYMFFLEEALACSLECQIIADGVPAGAGFATIPKGTVAAKMWNVGSSTCTISPRAIWEEATPDDGLPDAVVANVNDPSVVNYPLLPGMQKYFTIEVSVDPRIDATLIDGETILLSNGPDGAPRGGGTVGDSVEQNICIVPLSESSFSSANPPQYSNFNPPTSSGWGFQQFEQTSHYWVMQLQPVSADFSGREVRERESALTTVDGCWWTAAGPPEAHLDNSSWLIEDDIFYGFDRIGYFNASVNFYRGLFPAPNNIDVTPCGAFLQQKMSMSCKKINGDVWWKEYSLNVMGWGIDEICANSSEVPPSVLSERQIMCEDKVWQ